MKTTQNQQHEIDLQLGKFVFGTNSAFRIVENPEFVSLLRPGYILPNRQKLGDQILDEVYENELSTAKHELDNEIV